MATVTPTRPGAILGGEGAVVFHGIGWEGCQTLLTVRGERRWPRMVYLDGSVRLVSSSYIHEWRSERLGLFVMVVVEGLRIPCLQSGSTTFRLEEKEGGVEGEKTFYLAHAARIRGKTDIDLRADPPPDLAIEAVHTHGAEDAVEVYLRIGVPEAWVCDGESLEILARTPGGATSRSLGASRSPSWAPTRSWNGLEKTRTLRTPNG